MHHDITLITTIAASLGLALLMLFPVLSLWLVQFVG